MKQNLQRAGRASLSHLRVKPKTLVEEIKQKLREAIFTGLLTPGDRLIESELCESLGVSRPVLREAIRGLQAERLCEITPHRGAMIPILTWESAEQIYHVRALLEGEAAALCAANISDAELKNLGVKLKQFGEAVATHDPYQRVEATTQFYEIILRSSRNTIIEEVLLGLVARVNFLRSQSMSRPGRARKSYIEMKAIFDAIKARNPQQARATSKAHVLRAQEAARIVFGKQGEEEEEPVFERL